MLFNLDFANDNVLSWFFFFFLIIDLYFLKPAVFTQIFNPIEEFIISIGIRAKEAKVETETHPVTVETNISAEYDSKLYKFILIWFFN